LGSDLSISALAIGDDYWEHRADRVELAEGRVVSVFDYDSPWSWWERHPVGDELLFVLSGSVHFHLEDASGSQRVALGAGESCIVPQGTWHSAEIRESVRLLFVTPTPARTEHRPAAH
jgi:mannose-6-phosphate isomerase-like protein (cupin superfamily)